jgi:hypothetical protein
MGIDQFEGSVRTQSLSLGMQNLEHNNNDNFKNQKITWKIIKLF